jgi:4-amino-4-deoxy-L-arabinose transferase-like glycosyltransferase
MSNRHRLNPMNSSRFLLPAERLVTALTDPVRGERRAVLVIAAYSVVWALYGTIAKSSQDVHFDMGEAVALSHELAWGYPKHPPFSSWLVRAWFSVFPLTDASYYLFAMVVAAVGLWIAWRLAADYLSAERRVMGLALLTFIPFFNFHALKYNANTVLIPLWAATTWWFLRSFETRNISYAALAGLAAAAAMLGKYWSIVLLVGLGIAAIADPRRKDYFRSAAPWVTIAVGAIAMAPHIAWIALRDFGTFGYALESHPAASWAAAARSAVGYVFGTIGYAAIPILLMLVAAKPGKMAIADTLWPREPARRTALLAFALPTLLPVLPALATTSQVVSLWAIGGMCLLPVVLLSSPQLTITRAAVVKVVALAITFPLLALLASPLIAYAIHILGVPKGQAHARSLAAEIEKNWRAATNRPLRFVGGDPVLAFSTAFYLTDQPLALADFRAAPTIDPARVMRDGIVIACFVTEPECSPLLSSYKSTRSDIRRAHVEITRTFFGIRGEPERYVIVVVPPQQN